MEMGSRVIREADELVTSCFSVPGNAIAVEGAGIP